MSLTNDVAALLKRGASGSGQIDMLLAAEDKRKNLIERGILKKTERKVALPGENNLNYSNMVQQ